MGVGRGRKSIFHSANTPKDLFGLMEYVEESAKISDLDVGSDRSDSDNALVGRVGVYFPKYPSGVNKLIIYI